MLIIKKEVDSRPLPRSQGHSTTIIISFGELVQVVDVQKVINEMEEWNEIL